MSRDKIFYKGALIHFAKQHIDSSGDPRRMTIGADGGLEVGGVRYVLSPLFKAWIPHIHSGLKGVSSRSRNEPLMTRVRHKPLVKEKEPRATTTTTKPSRVNDDT
jgi:hypothetical protein